MKQKLLLLIILLMCNYSFGLTQPPPPPPVPFANMDKYIEFEFTNENNSNAHLKINIVGFKDKGTSVRIAYANDVNDVIADVNLDPRKRNFTEYTVRANEPIRIYGDVPEVWLANLSTDFTRLDISHNPDLEKINIKALHRWGKYFRLNKDLNLNFAENKKLKGIYVVGWANETLSFPENINLEEFEIYSSDITSIDVSNNRKLKIVSLGKCKDLTDISSVAGLDLDKFYISECIKIKKFPKLANLKVLELFFNRLNEEIDLSNCTKLEEIKLSKDLNLGVKYFNLNYHPNLNFVYMNTRTPTNSITQRAWDDITCKLPDRTDSTTQGKLYYTNESSSRPNIDSYTPKNWKNTYKYAANVENVSNHKCSAEYLTIETQKDTTIEYKKGTHNITFSKEFFKLNGDITNGDDVDFEINNLTHSINVNDTGWYEIAIPFSECSLTGTDGTDLNKYELTSDARKYNDNAECIKIRVYVEPKKLTASLTGNIEKQYDGNKIANLASSNYKLEGLPANEYGVRLNNTPASGIYDNKNAGENKTVTVTDLSIAGDNARKYILTNTTATGIGKITPKPLTASLTGNIEKQYNGNKNASLTDDNYNLTGFLEGDDVEISNTAGTYNNKNVGEGKKVTVTDITLAGDDANNYTVDTELSANIGTITPKDITVALQGEANKIYNRDTDATLTPNNYNLAGLVDGDNVKIANTVGTYDNKNVGNNKNVTVLLYNLTLSGEDKDNYILTNTENLNAAIGTITPKDITVALQGEVNKVYDGNINATIQNGNYTFNEILGDDVVSLQVGSATYDTKDAGENKTVTVSELSLNGTDAGNYNLKNTEDATLSGKIAKRPLTASIIGEVEKVYDSNTTATLEAGNYKLQGVISPDDVTLNNPTSGTYDTKNVGDNKDVIVTNLAITGTDAKNYTVNDKDTATVGKITPKDITVVLTGSVNKVYDGNINATIQNGNYTFNEILGDDVVSLQVGSATYDTKDAGENKIITISELSLNGTDAGNYNLKNTEDATLPGKIAKRPLTASIIGEVEKVYDSNTTATLEAGNYNLQGVISPDDVTLNNPVTGNYTDKNVGDNKDVIVTNLAITGTDAKNYTVNDKDTATVGKITPKDITVVLTGSVNKVYDGNINATIQNGNYTFNEILGDDVVSLQVGSATYDTKDAGENKIITISELSLNGTDAGNYNLKNTEDATLPGKIAKRPLTASIIGEVEKVYDSNTTATLEAGNYKLQGVISPDDVTLNNPVAGNYTDKNVGDNKDVIVTNLAITGTDAKNYTVNDKDTATVGKITPKDITVALTGSVNKVYDGNANAKLSSANYKFMGLIDNDDIELKNTVAIYEDKNVGKDKVVMVLRKNLQISGNDKNNYKLITPETLTANIGVITKRPLTASLIGEVKKIYDGNTDASLSDINYKLKGILAKEDVNLNNVKKAQYDNKNVGTNKTITVSNLVLYGADADNYLVNSTASADIGKITPKDLTITLQGVVKKEYDGNNIAYFAKDNFSSADLIANDEVEIIPANGTYDDKNISYYKTVTISLSDLMLEGTDKDNYTLLNTEALTATIGTITPKNLTASLQGTIKKIYDGDEFATLSKDNFYIKGVIDDEDVTLNYPAMGLYDDKNVGDYKEVTVIGLALAGTDKGNYTLNEDIITATIGEITQKGIVVTAENKEKMQGYDDPEFTYTVAPALYEDDEFFGSLMRMPGEEVGIYKILQGTLWAGENYDITFNEASLTIKAQPVSINHEISVYPSKVDTHFYVESDGEPRNLDIYNLLGKKVTTILINSPLQTVSVNDLEQGTYILKIDKYTFKVFKN